ncbi:MAG: cytochrome-c oxidase, cbb3-type subunit III [Rhodospirillaceae bacterium]|mgnify:FL=1|jgi:cytochrome c oxidase cbb3-type subunit III|nr:cytochrome-c oxidase, cbb3-type subunit III [Rhodospirillaceae bacterium]MBT5242780.1 cytochrome-c oxidase, cbb3-type subunit III [Rhodospirillaceae bacterium]MBT5562751.1 cytochrome-c oxidase, cbb3-type subunit III [Rhodospirillaceae bacterium]MBT6243256.1 cytochrome-c oxidase, cbb3-type subunit III [Rhodospirillaceae bacterium]
MANVEKDEISGQETTGHEWDGIKELNTPMPKWWLYTYYACIVFSVGYWVVYPAWPSLSGFTKGMGGYSSRADLDQDLASLKQERSQWSSKFNTMSIDEIGADQQLLNFAMAGGKFIFAENCAPCHGAAGSGAPGYPVLADDDWIWGGTREDIHTTVAFGIRSGHDDTRDSSMPEFLADEVLEKSQITDVTQYVLSLSNEASNADAAKRGAAVFEDECSSCHGEEAKGVADMGGPNLTDGIWLFGKDEKAVSTQIGSPKHGVMPAWFGRLSDVEIKQVSLYVHSLGGGQ